MKKSFSFLFLVAFLLLNFNLITVAGALSAFEARRLPAESTVTVSGYALSASCGDGTGFSGEFYLGNRESGILCELKENLNIELHRKYEVTGTIKNKSGEVKLEAETVKALDEFSAKSFKRLNIDEAKSYEIYGGRFVRLSGESSNLKTYEDGSVSSFELSEEGERITVLIPENVLSLAEGSEGKKALTEKLLYKRNVTADGFIAIEDGEVFLKVKDVDDIFVSYHNCNFETIEELKPTCEKEGAVIRQCSCGKTEETVIPMKAHSFIRKTEKATFESRGGIYEICELCEKINSEEVIYAANECRISTDSFVYNGREQKPEVYIKNEKGEAIEDFNAVYSDSTEIGKHSVTLELFGNYKGRKTFYYTIAPKAVSDIKKSVKNKTVSLSFSESEKASGYRIYLKNGDNLETLDTVEVSAAEINLPKYCEKYTLTVKVFTKTEGGVIWSKGKDVSVFTPPEKITGLKVESDFSSVTLSWKKSACASGYRIYILNEKTGNYKILATIKGNSYKAKDLKGNKKYSFAIKAYCEKSEKKLFSEAIKKEATTKSPKVSNLKAEAKYNSVDLSWRKVTGADGYRIYKYNEKKKKYTILDNVKNNTYTVKKLTSGKTYRFAVRPYKKDEKTYLGENVFLTVTTKLTAPMLTLKAAGGGKNISWKKVNGATGYEIYYCADRGGDYKKLKTLKSTSYVHKTKATYYYKVRAYKTVNGKKTYSVFSYAKKLAK